MAALTTPGGACWQEQSGLVLALKGDLLKRNKIIGKQRHPSEEPHHRKSHPLDDHSFEITNSFAQSKQSIFQSLLSLINPRSFWNSRLLPFDEPSVKLRIEKSKSGRYCKTSRFVKREFQFQNGALNVFIWLTVKRSKRFYLKQTLTESILTNV